MKEYKIIDIVRQIIGYNPNIEYIDDIEKINEINELICELIDDIAFAQENNNKTSSYSEKEIKEHSNKALYNIESIIKYRLNSYK